MSEDYTLIFYGAASSICQDLFEHFKRTEKDLKSLHIWRTHLSEIVVVLLDYPNNPMVGTLIRVFQRFVEEGSHLYYWKEVEAHAFPKGDYFDLMRYEEKWYEKKKYAE